MVQKYQSPIRVYKLPFELVMMSYERRFPSCPMIPVVVDCEIMSDTESTDGSQRITERRCKLNVDAPYLLKKLINVDFVYFIQKNTLDRRARHLNIECRNESFITRLIVLENCRYYVHPENEEWTCFEQSASLEIRAFFGFENTMEKLSMKQYSANIAKGKEIIEHFVNVLKEEGITSVPRWEETKSIQSTDEDSKLATSTELSLGASASHEPVAEATSPFQLETDYIQRYLGELTPMQESKLVLLRTWVADLQKGKVPSDGTLLRFLRARDFQVDKARELLSQSLIWRKKHQVGKILSEYKMAPVVKDYFPGGWHHQDKDGRPLYLLRLGQMDVKGLLKAIGEEGLLQLTLHICEEGLQLMEEATRIGERPISTWCLLVDLEGLNMRHLWRPGIKALLRIIEIVEANYPETMGRVLIVRAPRVFPILWTLVSTFIDENTRTKFLFYGGNDFQEPGGLEHYISPEFIPDFLGGSCTAMVGEGGLVPKSLYMTETEMEKERCPLTVTEDSIYKSVSLGRGHVHEVLVPSSDPGCVITWDFDVMRQDVTFALFRTHQPVAEAAHTADHRCVIEKSWKEGQDFFRVEQALVCHDGESIQGSHVTAHVGSYILQWRNHETDLLDTITAPRAQVMYHFEQLASADYRGSVSSLQSGFYSCSKVEDDGVQPPSSQVDRIGKRPKSQS